jgi:hypothetical protein
MNFSPSRTTTIPTCVKRRNIRVHFLDEEKRTRSPVFNVEVSARASTVGIRNDTPMMSTAIKIKNDVVGILW